MLGSTVLPYIGITKPNITWAAGGEHLQGSVLKVMLEIGPTVRLRDNFQIRTCLQTWRHYPGREGALLEMESLTWHHAQRAVGTWWTATLSAGCTNKLVSS